MLIVVMSFSGSIVFLAILICIFIGKKFLTSTWIYAMLKINLIFYCMPLPFLKYKYSDILSEILGMPFLQKTLHHPLRNIIQIEKVGHVFVDWKLYIFVIWAIWLVGLFLLYMKHIKQYNNLKIIERNEIEKSNYFEVFEKVKMELGIKTKIVLFCANDSMTICTMGIINKYIILPEKGITSENLYYIFKHELIHIKRKDVIYRYLAIFALLIHWFNPFIYLYFYIMTIYCEQSCDTVLVCNLELAEKKKYIELIINMALSKTKNQYQTYLSKSKRIIEGRLKNMMKIGKTKMSVKICSFLIGGMILFCGSLTVFAYEEPEVITWQTEYQAEGLESKQVEREFIEKMDVQFSGNGAMIAREFIGEDGSSYNLTELKNINNEKIFCSHSFVSGYYKEHFRYSDNSCRTDYYNADRCEKCGNIVVKSYSHTDTSTKCIH